MRPRGSPYRRRERRPVNYRELVERFFWGMCLTGLVALSVAGASFAYRHVLRSGVIALKHVEVYGAQRVGEELSDYLQLRPRVHLNEIDPNKLRQRLDRHPWIRAIEIEKRYPHTLVVRIREREPAFITVPSLVVVDTEGARIKPFALQDQLDLPVVSGLAVTAAAPSLLQMAKFLQYWDAATGPVRVGEAYVVSPQEVLVYPVGGGPTLLLPLDVEQWPQARARLMAVLAEARRLGLAFEQLDLCYRDRVVAQRKTEGAFERRGDKL